MSSPCRTTRVTILAGQRLGLSLSRGVEACYSASSSTPVSAPLGSGSGGASTSGPLVGTAAVGSGGVGGAIDGGTAAVEPAELALAADDTLAPCEKVASALPPPPSFGVACPTCTTTDRNAAGLTPSS